MELSGEINLSFSDTKADRRLDKSLYLRLAAFSKFFRLNNSEGL